MKDGTCKSCSWFKGNGKPCTKSGGVPAYLEDSCGAYRFKNTQSIIDRYFQEQKIARSEKMIRGIPL